jgi:hypothetical protein
MEQKLMSVVIPPKTDPSHISLKSKDNFSAHPIYIAWIQQAYQIGDDSYLELTNGKPLLPKAINYLKNRSKD